MDKISQIKTVLCANCSLIRSNRATISARRLAGQQRFPWPEVRPAPSRISRGRSAFVGSVMSADDTSADMSRRTRRFGRRPSGIGFAPCDRRGGPRHACCEIRIGRCNREYPTRTPILKCEKNYNAHKRFRAWTVFCRADSGALTQAGFTGRVRRGKGESNGQMRGRARGGSPPRITEPRDAVPRFVSKNFYIPSDALY